MAVVIPVETKLSDPAFPQLSKQEKQARANAIKMRKLQERHAKASLQETKQRLADRKRLLAASKRMERQLEKERKAASKARAQAKKEQQAVLDSRKQSMQAFAAGATGAAAALVLFAGEAFTAAASVERLEKASDAMGRRYGVTSAQIVQSMQDVSLGTISQRQALEASNKAMLLGIIRSEEEFAQMAKFAIVMGRAMGVDAAQAVDDLSTGLGRQSALILDNLGIIVDVDKANLAYAESVGKTVSELTDWDRKQAFINETLLAGQAAVEELGEITLDAAGKVERIKVSFEKLTVSVGKLLVKLSETKLGEAFDPARELDALAEGADAWGRFGDQVGFFTDAMSKVPLSIAPTIAEIRTFSESLFKVINPLEAVTKASITWYNSAATGKGFIETNQAAVEVLLQTYGDLAIDTIKLATDQDELGAAFAETQAAADALAASEAAQAAAEIEATKAAAAAKIATEEAAIAEKERAERLEEVTKIQLDVARELIDIDEQATEDLAEAWEDYYSDLEKLGKDTNEKRIEIEDDSAQEFLDNQEKFAEESKKISKDLAKDKAKLAKDLAKDLAKLDKDSSKNIARKQQDFAREDRQKAKRKQIDALGDERLFQFELRQLEAEGQGNAIAAALERREIEKQIEAEKTANEQATEEENRALEIERMKEDAAERAAELEAEAEERKEQLEAEAKEKQALLEEEAAKEEEKRKDELAKALADEQESFEERRGELGKFIDEKVGAIEEGKKEAISALARELAETEELTKSELGQLVDAAGTFGKKAGEAFAAGLRKGAETISNLSDLIPSGGGGGRTPGGAGGPGGTTPIGFQGGGSFVVGGAGGPDSQLVEFMATPGESVTVGRPTQQQNAAPQITINATGVAAEQLTSILELKVKEGIQQFNDEVLVPWAEGM